MERRDPSVGMTLTLGAVHMSLVMSQIQRVATLDDHAHQILRFLWRQVALQPGVTAATVATALAQWVGLLPDERLPQSATPAGYGCR